jgi:hypothetical protein
MRRTLMRSAVTMALLTVLATWGAPAGAQVSPEEAHSTGVDAYLYFYPLVTMDVTRRQLTNVEPAREGSAVLRTRSSTFRHTRPQR